VFTIFFEGHAVRTPLAIAAEFGTRCVTYGELNRRANQLAHYLVKLGVKPDVRVGISMERSPELLVALLGTLKAGGTYVPLDPAYPHERLAYMLEDSGARILLSESGPLWDPPARGVAVVGLDEDWEKIAVEPEHSPAVALSSENLAYIIYTSGSNRTTQGRCSGTQTGLQSTVLGGRGIGS